MLVVAADDCKMGPQTLSSTRRSRSPRLSDGVLKVVEFALISTRGIIPNALVDEGGLPQVCLSRRSKWADTGSDGNGLDELKRDFLKPRNADWFVHGRF